MKLKYRNKPLEMQVMPHDGRRWVVELNAVGLSQLGRVKNNPGIVAFSLAVHATKARGGNLCNIQDYWAQVQTTGIQHDWIWPVSDESRYIVLVWPFHAPKTWQIVGYMMTDKALSYPENESGGRVIPWSDFEPFILEEKQIPHNPTSLYSAPPPTNNGRLQETASN